MAKIAILSQKITPQVLGLAQALQFHRHEITLVTSYQEPVPDGTDYPVLTYFKTWSAWEALRLFPKLLAQAPQVWHFVFSDMTEERPSGAHFVLAQLAKALPHRVVASSFYDNLHGISTSRMAPLTKSCDIVTTASRENLMYIKRRSWLNRCCETEVLPPFIFPHPSEDNEVDQELGSLLKSISPYLVVPGEELPASGAWEMLLPEVNILVCGSRPKSKIRPLGFELSQPGVYFAGPHLSDSQMSQALAGSLGLLTALDDLSVIELMHLHHLCQQTRTPVLASPRQQEALPGFCVPRRNGFVLENGLHSLRYLLSVNSKLELSQAQFESIKTELADSALNELNRLYLKVQIAKSSSFDRAKSPLS
ncbi:MAG: hypothetical protein COT73_09370 [Bdellovibrio sp. CG10_big_fil_rev_8_21_14_0_10_47_8]|nr:MAG: hypothetical protein COT73_09370 [Bdellovibrio sp. CG10_big_fil_rev_8_21_14_0_10_47_8]